MAVVVNHGLWNAGLHESHLSILAHQTNLETPVNSSQRKTLLFLLRKAAYKVKHHNIIVCFTFRIIKPKGTLPTTKQALSIPPTTMHRMHTAALTITSIEILYTTVKWADGYWDTFNTAKKSLLREFNGCRCVYRSSKQDITKPSLGKSTQKKLDSKENIYQLL